jgi:general secretion pathway protein D
LGGGALGGASPNSNSPGGGAGGAGGAEGGNPRTAAAQFGGVPVATLNSELNALGQSGSGGPQLPNVRITADLLNNAVLIYARPDEYKLIERTLMQLDRPKLQVAIDVTIAEVTLNDQLNYGVQFFLSGGAVSNTTTGTIPSIINNVASNTGSTTTGTGLSGGLNIIAGHPASPRVVINALSQLTDVKILSNPSLVVVDNGQASLEVGDQVPIATGSATVLSANNAVVNTVDYKNTGVILQVQPHVNYNGSVLLDIDQLVSEPTGSSLTPTISQREVKSTISVVSGQTVLLAGMIQDNLSKSREGIPILSQLPYVGAAFGTTGKSDVRTELIMFIRPTIIRDGADASMVAEELRAKMRGGKTQALTLPTMLNILSRPAQ